MLFPYVGAVLLPSIILRCQRAIPQRDERSCRCMPGSATPVPRTGSHNYYSSQCSVLVSRPTSSCKNWCIMPPVTQFKRQVASRRGGSSTSNGPQQWRVQQRRPSGSWDDENFRTRFVSAVASVLPAAKRLNARNNHRLRAPSTFTVCDSLRIRLQIKI